MSGAADSARLKRLERMYRDRARAEIASAERLVPDAGQVASSGDELADVLLLKGEPGPGDIAAGTALGGEDGVAAAKALDALGLPQARFAACSRLGADATARTKRLRLLVEAVDPRLIVALDPIAADDLAEAFGEPTPPAGERVRMLGRDVVALGGLEASLGDPALKRQVWVQMQALRPFGLDGAEGL